MVVWSAKNKFQLLLNIIGQNETLNINYDNLAASMGADYTVESVRQAFKKIKKDAAAAAGTQNGVSTPKKGAPRTPSKRKGQEISNGGEDDEELDSKSPKKAKKTTVKLKAKDEEEE